MLYFTSSKVQIFKLFVDKVAEIDCFSNSFFRLLFLKEFFVWISKATRSCAKSRGSGGFIKLVNTALNDLKKNPHYQIRYDNFRMKIVKKFPYVIHYILDENRQIVFVYGIRNSYQDPDKYPKE